MVAFPLAIEIRSGAVAALPRLLGDGRISAGGHVAVVVGPGQGEEVAAELRPRLANGTVHPVSGGTVAAAHELVEILHQGSFDAVVGIGGGRTLDVAKYAAGQAGLPMVSVATNLAHDGLASPVASLEDGGRKGSYGVPIPIAVVVDLDYVRRSPPEQLRSGIGDALSNLGALADWELAAADRGEPVDGLAAAFARSGAEALLRRTDDLGSDGFHRTLAEALVLGGLAMAVAGSSRPCSGACHEISHALDALHPGQASHGEQVAVGSLFASFLRQDELFEPLGAAFGRHGVARTPGDLGLSEDQFCAAVEKAPSTRPDRYTILERLELDEGQIRERVRSFVDAVDR
ncbi:MAG TPA: iron-containing alcohol dehydrogenase family protein [Gaiellaceae bacterium]|nr:iron-containing alcohol dehydrogenase family protein [Gaiellaceae bacterium]